MKSDDILAVSLEAYNTTYIIEMLEQKIADLEGKYGKNAAVIAHKVLDNFRSQCLQAERQLRYQEGFASAKAFIDQIRDDLKIVNMQQAQEWAEHYDITLRDILDLINDRA